MTVASSRLTTFASAGWLSATVAFAKADSSAAGAGVDLGRAARGLGRREGVGQHEHDRWSRRAVGRARGRDHAALERGLLGLEDAVGQPRGANRAEGGKVQAADQRGGEVAAVRRGRREEGERSDSRTAATAAAA